MRVGYGYRRTENDFEGLGVEQVWIDTPKSDRDERAFLFSTGLRSGDTLVMLGRGDLGYGRELKRLRERLEAMKVTIEYVDKGPADPAPRGRPKGFNPTPEHDVEVKAAWHDEDRPGSYALKVANRLGYGIEPHHLKYRYGKRFN